VTFIALCGDTRPHFTTIAHFISTADMAIATVFGAVLAVCDRQGLIGRAMLAIDGVKLPSNASKHRSGTRSELAARVEAGGGGADHADAASGGRHAACRTGPAHEESAAARGVTTVFPASR
jgi:hypothetical protein